MGACMSSGDGPEVSEADKALHRQVEKELQKVRHFLNIGVF